MPTLTDLIYQSKAPYKNPYQGKDKRVVFVCSAGLLRSATGARLYAKKFNTRAAGSESYALVPLSPNLIVWAQELVFVNKENYQKAVENFGEAILETNTVVLDIPDKYEHMHPQLVEEFRKQYGDFE